KLPPPAIEFKAPAPKAAATSSASSTARGYNSHMSIEAALHRSVQDARDPTFPGPDGHPRTIHVAIGDAQAPLGTFLAILHRHGLLGANGRLKESVHLISI